MSILGKNEEPTVRMSIHLSPKLDLEFRQTVGEAYGAGRGKIKIAIDEAIKDWVDKKQKELKGRKK